MGGSLVFILVVIWCCVVLLFVVFWFCLFFGFVCCLGCSVGLVVFLGFFGGFVAWVFCFCFLGFFCLVGFFLGFCWVFGRYACRR